MTTEVTRPGGATQGMRRLVVAALGAWLVACTGPEGEAASTVGSDPEGPTASTEDTASSSHLAYYGFTLIDTAVDDPTDDEARTNYADEVAGFTNLADILVIGPNDDIRDRIAAMDALGMASLLHLHFLFYEHVGGDAPSGADFALYDDYEQRWQTFVRVNELDLYPERLGALYLGEEPTWNGVSAEELAAASDLIDATLPTVPIAIVEAYPAIDDLVVPASADWVGFDHYGFADPAPDPSFLDEFERLKGRRSTPDQRTILVMDSHFISFLHGTRGLEIDDMGDVARSYAELAAADESVVALLGYVWPSGFDHPSAVGARGMPGDVRATYEAIGRDILGR